MSDREDDHAAALDRLEDLIVADDSPHSTLAAAGDMRARGSHARREDPVENRHASEASGFSTAHAPGKNRTCARGLGNRCSIH